MPLGVLIFGWSIVAHFTVWVSIIGFAVICFGMSQGNIIKQKKKKKRKIVSCNIQKEKEKR